MEKPTFELITRTCVHPGCSRKFRVLKKSKQRGCQDLHDPARVEPTKKEKQTAFMQPKKRRRKVKGQKKTIPEEIPTTDDAWSEDDDIPSDPLPTEITRAAAAAAEPEME